MINESEFVFEGDLATCAENYEVSADTKTKVSYDSKYLSDYLIIFRLHTAQDQFISKRPFYCVENCLRSIEQFVRTVKGQKNFW